MALWQVLWGTAAGVLVEPQVVLSSVQWWSVFVYVWEAAAVVVYVPTAEAAAASSYVCLGWTASASVYMGHGCGSWLTG
jgi:hypothetical protein